MESLATSSAKRLLAEYLEANRDYEPISDCEQKEKLRKEIDQKRAYRNDLQRMVSALTILHNGIQNGAESGNMRRAILRESQDSVRSIISKEKSNGQRQETVAPSNILQVQLNKMIEEKFKETIRYQEEVLGIVHRSRVFLTLRQAKEEVLKAQQSLDEIQSAITKTVQNSNKENYEMFQNFVDLAVVIGEEQERLELKQVLTNEGSMRRRESQQERIDNDHVLEPVVQMECIVVEQPVTAPCTNDEQQKDKYESRDLPIGLSFSNIMEDFPIGSTFKNPNDYPEILGHIGSPQRYTTVQKETATSFQKYHHQGNHSPTAEDKVILRKPMRRRSSIEIHEEETECSTLPSPRKRKTKTSVARQPQKLQRTCEKAAQHTETNTQQKEMGKKEAANKTPSASKSRGKMDENVDLQRKKEHIAPGQATAIAEKLLVKRTLPKSPTTCRNVSASLTNIGVANPKLKATTDVLAVKRTLRGRAYSPDIFKPPPSIGTIVKPSTKQHPRDPSIKQFPTQKEQHLSPSTTDDGSKSPTRKSLRDLSARRETPPTPEKQSTRMKKPEHKPPIPTKQAPTAHENTEEPMEMDNLIRPATSSSSLGSLDFGLQSSSNEFDFNVLAGFQDVCFKESSADMDDLDFLMNDEPLASSSSKTAKMSKSGGDSDGFNFDFGAQDSNYNIEQSGDDLF